jgi:chromosomal replication initiation ATPase DnaA
MTTALSKATSPFIVRSHGHRKFKAPWPSWYQPPIMPRGRARIANATDLIKAACLFTGVTPTEYRSEERFKAVSRARHAVVYVLHRYRPDMSYVQIAKATHRKCHSTIINSYNQAKKLRQVDADFAALVTKLESTVNGTS